MMNLFNIHFNCICNKEIAPERFFEDMDSSIANIVEHIIWYASLKPSLIDAEAVVDQTCRFEEIQILQVSINDPDMLFQVLRPIYKSIKYPTLVIIQYKSKFSVSACQFYPGKKDYNENILRTPSFTHWIYPELLSKKATSFFESINNAINNGNTILSIYTKMYNAVLNFQFSGITKAHVARLIKDMCGKPSLPHLLDNCTPYKKHAPTDNSLRTKYDKNARTNSYIYRYDTEDIWFAFMCCEQTRNIIEKRRYRDIEDLIYAIDTKYEEGF